MCTPQGLQLHARLGISAGKAVAGVQGVLQPRYTVLGESIVEASELERLALPDTVHCSVAFLQYFTGVYGMEGCNLSDELMRAQEQFELETASGGGLEGGHPAHFGGRASALFCDWRVQVASDGPEPLEPLQEQTDTPHVPAAPAAPTLRAGRDARLRYTLHRRH